MPVGLPLLIHHCITARIPHLIEMELFVGITSQHLQVCDADLHVRELVSPFQQHDEADW